VVEGSAPIDGTYTGVSFVVRDAFKTTDHPFYGQGFPVGYVVNGSQGPELILTVGYTYTFVVNSLCNHPMYFSSSITGQGDAEITEGVVAANRAMICGGATVTFTPGVDLIGTPVYYQCRVHSKMGYKITIKPETICNKYSRALTLTNVQLVTTVVTGAFTQLVAPTSPLLGFFDGTYNAVNYTNPANAAATTNLANHLVQFFGAALGCTDPSYPPYTGNTDLHAVHIALPIGSFEFSAFNNIVIGVMAGAGVSQGAGAGVAQGAGAGAGVSHGAGAGVATRCRPH